MSECSGCQEILPIVECNACGFDYCNKCIDDFKNHQPCSKQNSSVCDDCNKTEKILWKCHCKNSQHSLCTECYHLKQCLLCQIKFDCTDFDISNLYCSKCDCIHCDKCECLNTKNE